MARRRIRLSDRAVADLETIVGYTRQHWGERQARRYANALRNALRRLRDRPALGRSRDDVLPGVRSFPCGSHVLFYREIADGIAVLRILHGGMDVADRMTNDDEA